MKECLCRVTITDMKGGAHVVEVKASSLFEAVAQAIKIKGGHIATDGFRPIKVLVFEPKKEYQVKLKDFMAWLDRHGRSPRDIVHRLKIREILGVNKLH
jgi:hypothetical protein